MATASALDKCPDEVLLRIFELIDAAEDLLNVTATSKRIRAVALDNTLWSNHCARIFSICPEGNSDDASSRNDVGPQANFIVDPTVWDAQSCLELYLGLRKWAPYLGWWVPDSDDSSMPMRLATDAHSGTLVCSWIDIQLEFDLNQPLLPGTRLVRFHWGVHLAIGAWFEQENLSSITVQNIRYTSSSPTRFHWRQTGMIGAGSEGYGAGGNTSFHATPPSSQNWEPWNLYKPKRMDRAHNLFPSPSMITALRGASVDHEGDLVCAASEGRAPDGTPVPISYAPIHPPNSPSWNVSLRDPIDSGLYVSSYGAHGTELLAVTFRTLTSEDFFYWNDKRRNELAGSGKPWPWDAHLSADDPKFHYGPFSPTLGGSPVTKCGSVEASDLCPGRQIMEVTKLTGDVNVPRGQRTLIAFLDIPRDEVTSADMARRNQAVYESRDWGDLENALLAHVLDTATDAVLPQKSRRSPVAPWPIYLDENDEPNNARPGRRTRVLSEAEMMKPGAGWVVHGIGHISDSGFRSPSWSPSVIHFASREEFQVMWLGMVMTFTKLL